MGVVNVTPDSFSDGGLYAEVETAVAHGLEMLEQGADLLDIGGESTRPGATRPVVADELARVVPVISGLTAAGALVSVDTMRAEVAEAALAAGAVLVNDVSGGLADPDILKVVAEHDAAYVAMHWRAHASEMQQRATYSGPDQGGVVGDVRAELGARVEAALAAGIRLERLAIDPGLGFAKTADHNWELLAGLDAFEELGLPILVGSSRKSFLGSLLADADGTPRPVLDREDANVALTTLAGVLGVWTVRVHEVRGSVDALRVVARWQGRSFGPAVGRSERAGRVEEE
ncbi:dihydropteroate synthase [Nocardioides marmoriginsengisoli]|uniref:dihydropteroate synthase n=1 Tax=Nocardioides marmoriginsengisoli TaxID=661483 RepID=A0A3N0CIR1_9ACTN|nr:dihydropteroate synthase [Nocardioides marmoriginsengisoli]RNL63332.1 dihydropteroate synthase [Nocardioides marmoriginsengisoli]